MIKKILIILAILVLATPALATNYYIAKGVCSSACDGTTWAKAWDDFNVVSWTAGEHNYYIAGGTYVQNLIPGASGTDDAHRLIIKRATASDHGADNTNWNAAYDAQVILNDRGINVCGRNYVTVDGVTASGIKIQMTSFNTLGLDVGSSGCAHSNYITLRYIEVQGPGMNTSGSAWFSDPCTYGNTFALVVKPLDAQTENLVVEYCKFHDLPAVLIHIANLGTKNTLFQYNEFYNFKDDSTGNQCHADGIKAYDSQNVTIRFNKFYNGQATFIRACTLGSGSDNWDIYGNLFYNTGTWRGLAEGFSDSGGHTETNIRLYNNTMIGMWRCWGLQDGTDSGIARNNICYDYTGVSPVVSPSQWTLSNNWYSGNNATPSATEEPTAIKAGSLDPFVDSAHNNYQIISTVGALYPKDKGINLGSPYDIDMNGNTRGVDGTWDIGAYEYAAGDTTPPTVTISTSSPQAISSDTLTVTGTASDDTAVSGCKWRIGAEPTSGAGSACTGTTSWSCATSGYSSGTNTLYVECYDAVPNYSTGHSITVNYSPPAASARLIGGTCPGCVMR